MMSLARKLSALTVASLLSCSAYAATFTLTPNPATGQPGDSVTLAITIDKGADAISGAQGSVTVPAGVTVSTTVVQTSPAIKNCDVDASTGNVFYAFTAIGAELENGVLCNISVTIPASATAGTNYDFAFGGSPTTQDVSTSAGSVAGNTYTDGRVTVEAAPADTAPTFTGTVNPIPTTPDPVIGRPSANGNIQFVGAGGEGASENTGSISCTAAAPFSIVSGGTQSGLGNGNAAPVNFNCTPAAAAVNANISCTLNGATPAETFDVTCPAGVEPPPVTVPPTPEVVPASSHLSQLLLVILLGMFGMGAVYLVRRS